MTKDQLLDQFIENLKAANPEATEAQMAHNRALMEGWDISVLERMVQIDFNETI
jgi:hypothetical protein